jgi:hypothetical protein
MTEVGEKIRDGIFINMLERNSENINVWWILCCMISQNYCKGTEDIFPSYYSC